MTWQLWLAGAGLAASLAMGAVTCNRIEKVGELKKSLEQATTRIVEANKTVENCNATVKKILGRAADVRRDPGGTWNGLLDPLRTLPPAAGTPVPAPGKSDVRR